MKEFGIMKALAALRNKSRCGVEFPHVRQDAQKVFPSIKAERQARFGQETAVKVNHELA